MNSRFVAMLEVLGDEFIGRKIGLAHRDSLFGEDFLQLNEVRTQEYVKGFSYRNRLTSPETIDALYNLVKDEESKFKINKESSEDIDMAYDKGFLGPHHNSSIRKRLESAGKYLNAKRFREIFEENYKDYIKITDD